MEEERRLCYVGITRAQKKLFISRASQRMLYNQVNRKMISYKKIQDVLVVFKEFEKTTTRKIIRQKVADTYKAAGRVTV